VCSSILCSIAVSSVHTTCMQCVGGIEECHVSCSMQLYSSFELSSIALVLYVLTAVVTVTMTYLLQQRLALLCAAGSA
jgi:hypothetical protein